MVQLSEGFSVSLQQASIQVEAETMNPILYKKYQGSSKQMTDALLKQPEAVAEFTGSPISATLNESGFRQRLILGLKDSLRSLNL